MSAGYRSLAARHLGGASSAPVAIIPGNRAPLPGYLGRAGSVSLAATYGVRSMLAYWMGGACSFPFIEPPIPPEKPAGGGGMGYRRSLDLARDKAIQKRDDEEIALLVPIIWTTING